MNNQGWIKIHRKILDTSFAKKPTISWLFIVLLLKANHAENKFLFNKQEITIQAGQLLTGVYELAKDTGLTVMQVRYGLQCLKVTNTLTIKTTNKFSIITILNYNQYQEFNKQINKPITNKQQTSNKPVTTNNNDKNDNNEKKEERDNQKNYLINEEELKKDYIDKVFDKYNVSFIDVKRKAEQLYDYCQSKGKKYKDYKSFLKNALIKDFGYRFKN